MRRLHYSQAAIAKELSRLPRTNSRELKRNITRHDGWYSAEKVQLRGHPSTPRDRHPLVRGCQRVSEAPRGGSRPDVDCRCAAIGEGGVGEAMVLYVGICIRTGR